MHPNLSPDLSALVETAATSQKIDLAALARGTFLEISTASGSLYRLVVIDPKTSEVAWYGGRESDLQKPHIFYLQGSTNGGSSVVMGQIIIGMHLQLNCINGGFLETSCIAQVKTINDPARATEILKEAEARRPKEVTPEECAEAEKKVEQWMQETFPADSLTRIHTTLNLFGHPEARARILGILYQAQLADKLSPAFDALEKAYKQRWAYQPPTIRGTILSERDIETYDAVCQKVGLPLESSKA